MKLKKFKYNPTLDRLLLAANYAQAGKTKKLGKILDEIASDENVEKDVEALNALQVASSDSKSSENAAYLGAFHLNPDDTFVISVAMTRAGNRTGNIVTVWSTEEEAETLREWWPRRFYEPSIQFIIDWRSMHWWIERGILSQLGPKKSIKIPPSDLMMLSRWPRSHLWKKGVNKGEKDKNKVVNDFIAMYEDTESSSVVKNARRRLSTASRTMRNRQPDVKARLQQLQ